VYSLVNRLKEEIAMKRLFDLVKKLRTPGLKGNAIALVLTLLVFTGAVAVKADTFVVDSTLDAADDNPGDTFCDDGSGNCTLRAAVMESNALAGEDEIILSGETYMLTIFGGDDEAANGDLDIRDSLIIRGTGAESTIIDSNGTRAFHLVDGDDLNQVEVEIYDLTIVNSLAGNAGGAIRNVSEILTIDGLSLRDNSAPRGAGIYVGPGAETEIMNSAIHNNTATGDPGNERGGGIYNSGDLVLTNVTISNNTAGDLGGGIFNDSAITAFFLTIAENVSPIGGGIHQAVGGDTDLFGSIIAGNTSDDCAGILIDSLGFNVSTSNCNLTDPTDMPDTDPLVGPLQDNGGETFTHALLDGSPAIDFADNDFACFGIAVDQRGVVRPIDGDGDGGAICDAGAFEFELPADPGDGSGGCSIARTEAASKSFPLYLFALVFILVMRFIKRGHSAS
jgi:hypothetical protein